MSFRRRGNLASTLPSESLCAPTAVRLFRVDPSDMLHSAAPIAPPRVWGFTYRVPWGVWRYSCAIFEA